MLCNLCPRRCNALRTDTVGEGYCRMPAAPVAARAALHMWEEPPISGARGSGTIFFSGCSLGCVFCQNEKISHQDFGRPVTVERLREICLELVAQGAHNINFVNPTHYAHVVRQVLEEPLPVPAVWNSGGYDRVETLRALEGRVSIYLPDFKYLDPETAGRYSAAPDYPQAAQAAIRERDRALLPHEPVHPLGRSVPHPGAEPPPAPGGDGERHRLHAESGAPWLLPGAHQRQGGVHPSL